MILGCHPIVFFLLKSEWVKFFLSKASLQLNNSKSDTFLLLSERTSGKKEYAMMLKIFMHDRQRKNMVVTKERNALLHKEFL